ncbi:uncharacterized protein PHACADRAFT_266420 [Phanerochaete carnosa HHB-10118-sp]|uniref:Uncharacterized protein n=1 Tax=Phanerochaete carnosa (strain HHB-10118-sp) TaxID=650164 RepID=K5VNQ7_PHACS|nr:uncharacterized protein PHACADRAFT_252500 [Phanerochaete carnosa HHB-10118-sp]XP_007403128.1 uncharacterized protein PHACADRAFT_266420 [Phanerochaete carnosa HHB-10118-sp]EKM48320.1 hypothetical protein PHACADRAFT_266420 [Phanerochaete carnosa HHB-10118-sp]EKM58291.1 hypothetical protein PHACADRAFT_252500 [Phanerochaete carnosa HHB-10118-sp]
MRTLAESCLCSGATRSRAQTASIIAADTARMKTAVRIREGSAVATRLSYRTGDVGSA